MEFNINILDDLRAMGQNDLLQEIFDQFSEALVRNEPINLISVDSLTNERIPMGFIGSILELNNFKVNYLAQ